MIQNGILLDFTQLKNTKDSKPDEDKKETPEQKLKNNAINLVCGAISLLEIEVADPWKFSDLKIDKEVQSFYYLASLLNDSIRGYIESMIFRAIISQTLLTPHEYDRTFNKIKFK